MVWYCIVLSLVLWRLVRQEIPPLNVFNHTMGAKHGNTHELFEGKILTPVAHSWTSYPEHFPSSLGRTSCRKSQTERWRGDRVSLIQRMFNPKFITCSRPRGLELVNTIQVIKPRLDWKICLKQKIDATVLVKNSVDSEANRRSKMYRFIINRGSYKLVSCSSHVEPPTCSRVFFTCIRRWVRGYHARQAKRGEILLWVQV
jgi:hypothetical protein